MNKLAITLLIALFCTMNAYACRWDTDCSVGSTCVKQDESLYGVCMGGVRPGNSNDDAPARSLIPGDRLGKTCSFDTDCGFNRECKKSSYSVYGTCY